VELPLHQEQLRLLRHHLRKARRAVAEVSPRRNQLSPLVLLRPLFPQPRAHRRLDRPQANIVDPVNARENTWVPRHRLAVRLELHLQHRVRMARRAASSAQCPLNLRDNRAAHQTRHRAGIAVLQRPARLLFPADRAIDLKGPSISLDKARPKERLNMRVDLGVDNLLRAQAHIRVPAPARNDMWAHRSADLGADSRHHPKRQLTDPQAALRLHRRRPASVVMARPKERKSRNVLPRLHLTNLRYSFTAAPVQTGAVLGT
jgi:hypothetical protein